MNEMRTFFQVMHVGWEKNLANTMHTFIIDNK